MLDISLVSDIMYLVPEEELNKDSYCELTVISHWVHSSGLNNRMLPNQIICIISVQQQKMGLILNFGLQLQFGIYILVRLPAYLY